MATPDFQTLMLPLLNIAGDGAVHSISNARDTLAREFQLTEAEQEELIPSGRAKRFATRVAWAKVYLQQAGLISSPRRAHFQITDTGRAVLRSPPQRIDIRFLQQFSDFQSFRARKREANDTAHHEASSANSEEGTPDEALEAAHLEMREALSLELLERIKQSTPGFFEGLVIELLVAIGYGGSRADAGKAIGRSGDEGIDGVIWEDRLGLDVVYVQAKKWQDRVGRPEIQKFAGALQGKRARKGVFITTGSFTADAENYVEHIEPKIVLVDGSRLTELMIDHEVGVTTKATYALKRLDNDYFDEG
jgi:restriction system protein